jgi:eukaryotic-like serine/threonine-protein kinase
MACAHALASALVGAENPKPPPSERAERQALLDQAVATLKKAIAAGFADFAFLQKDTDLDPLRGRADFQELMKDLASRANRSK